MKILKIQRTAVVISGGHDELKSITISDGSPEGRYESEKMPCIFLHFDGIEFNKPRTLYFVFPSNIERDLEYERIIKELESYENN